MGFFQFIRKIFTRKVSLEAQGLALESQQALATPSGPSVAPSEIIPERTEIERGSYELGLAAGYTGRSIKEIESALNRIESQMATKDWVTARLLEQNSAQLDYLRKHEENEQKRFELLKQALNLPTGKIPKLQPVGTTTLPLQTPLSPKMERVLLAIREAKEISYDDLSLKLDISLPELRGLLAAIASRTNVIERFRISRKGWVHYKGEKESD